MRDIWEENREKDFININHSSKIRSMTNHYAYSASSKSDDSDIESAYKFFIVVFGGGAKSGGGRKAHTHGT